MSKKTAALALSALIAAMAVVPMAISFASASSGANVYGDLNRDGVVDICDLIVVQRAVKGAGTLTESQKKAADINGDGVVDQTDLALLKKLVLSQPGVPGYDGPITEVIPDTEL